MFIPFTVGAWWIATILEYVVVFAQHGLTLVVGERKTKSKIRERVFLVGYAVNERHGKVLILRLKNFKLKNRFVK